MDTRTSSADADTHGGQGNRNLRRKRLLLTLAGVIAVVAVVYGLYWFFVASKHVTTDNAYVGADTATVTPLIDGNVIAVRVASTQAVHAGDVIVELDPADAKIDLDAAQANLIKAQRTIEQAFANNDALSAQVRAREANLQRAQQDLERRKSLRLGRVVAVEDYRHYEQTLASAEADLDAAKAQLAASQALTSGFTVDTHPDVVHARAQVEQAQLALSRTVLRAPIDGIVAQRNVQVGERVAAGAPVMSIVPIISAYVDANFKEVQLGKVRAGQCAVLISDFYGSDVKFHGRVVGFAGGTGAAFALIPAQNATGNWIKIVQRLPVRIGLDPAELREHPLRVGLSMHADIHLRGCDGTAPARQ